MEYKMVMDIKSELKGQLITALIDAEFPIHSSEELNEAFFDEPKSGKHRYMNLHTDRLGSVLTHSDFPFQNAESVAEKILSRTHVSELMTMLMYR
jgi:hypothetical protein